MPLIRPTALRSLPSTLRHSGARITARAAPARTQLVAKRFASGGGHGGGHGASSSDLPWLLAALAITPPSCWYLWPDSSSHSHGGHGDHGEYHEKEAEKEESTEESAEEEEQSSGGEQESVEKPDEKKEDQPEVEESSEETDAQKEDKSEKQEEEDTDEEKKDKPEADEKTTSEKVDEEKKSTDAPGRNTKERTFTVGASEETDPENKGAATASSSKGMKLGDKTSEAPAAKPRSTSDGDMSKKQEGMSNTDTKYSVPIDQGSEKSKKGDGQPDTAKSKGTIDPNAEAPKPPVSRDE